MIIKVPLYCHKGSLLIATISRKNDADGQTVFILALPDDEKTTET